MTSSDFLHLLESVLRQRRLPFSRAAAIAFTESSWELIDDEPDVWFWAERFVEADDGRPPIRTVSPLHGYGFLGGRGFAALGDNPDWRRL